MLRQHGTALLPLLFVAALAGCASLTRPSQTPVSARPLATTIVAFEFTGRISVRHGDARYVANIAWQHDAAHDEILLSSPLGQGLAELSRDATGARLRTADQRRIDAADWEGLALQAFGAELPLAMLPRWIVADAPEGAQRDGAGRPLAFRQDGWSVDYGSYESDAAEALPQFIAVKRADIELRMKIDAWQSVR